MSLTNPLPCLFVCLWASALAGSEVIDRVAVIVGTQVITDSEVRQNIRLAAFLNGDDTVDLGAEARRRAAERLVDQVLIRRELESGRYPAGAPGIEGLLSAARARWDNAPGGWKPALERYGISEQELTDHLKWQATLVRFIDIRFRTGVQIAESDLREYYDEQIAGKAAGEIPPFESVRVRIEEILLSQRADQALDRWLGAARNQVRTRFREEAFQ